MYNDSVLFNNGRGEKRRGEKREGKGRECKPYRVILAFSLKLILPSPKTRTVCYYQQQTGAPIRQPASLRNKDIRGLGYFLCKAD